MKDTDYRVSGNDVLTRRHNRFMGCHGQHADTINGQSFRGTKSYGSDWLKIGTIVARVNLNYLGIDTDGIVNIFYVNMIGDETNTHIFHQVSHDETRFGKIIYVERNKKRIDRQDNTIVKECKSRFMQKSKMRFDRTRPMEDTLEWYSGMPVYKNGERIGGYDEDIVEQQKKTAFMSKEDRIKMEARLRQEKQEYLLKRANIERKQANKKEINPAKLATISTAQPTANRPMKMIPYIQAFTHKVLSLSVDSDKKYILNDARCLVVR